MKTISQYVEKCLAWFLVVLMIAIVLDVTWQVVSRFLLADPSSYTEELARFLLMWIGLIGAAYAYRRHSHLSLDLLLMSASLPHKLLLLRAIHCVSFIFAASAMVYGGSQLMALTLSLKQTSAALGVPIGYVYSCIPLSGILICWFALENFLHPDPSTITHTE